MSAPGLATQRLPHRLAVIGFPVEHSQSPFIHSAFARASGLSVDYQRMPVTPGDFGRTLRDFANAGAWGCNVTVPFKFEVPALCAHVSERATRAGAANTLRFDASGWSCDNTDGVGLMRDLRHNAGLSLAGRRVLLLGAGGAAAGVLGPLLDEGPAEVLIANRSAQRAQALAERHADLADRGRVRLRAQSLADGVGPEAGRFDLVINATASSLAGAAVPVGADVLAPGACAVDLMYGPAAAPFLRWAEDARAQARDGLGMLVEQAAVAFDFFFGHTPDTAPVLSALRARLALPADPS
jgi:shikimate dehydrogenase